MAVKSKTVRVSAEDYIYASARVRAGEVFLLRKADLAALAESADLSFLLDRLAERHFPLRRTPEGEVDIEASLDAYLAAAYDKVRESVPDPGLFAFLRYPYDCHNIKSALKCRARGMALSPLFLPFGTVAEALLQKAMESDDFSAFPPAMAEAASKAVRVYAASKDPQAIDLLLDRACYEDMLASAGGYTVPAFTALVKTKIDLSNLITYLRVTRLGNSESDYSESFLPGGTLAPSFFAALFAGKPWERALSVTPYKKLAGEEKAPFARLEKLSDEIALSLLSDDAKKTYGPGVIAAYLLQKEVEVKNLRILLTAKKAGVAADAIKARLREV